MMDLDLSADALAKMQLMLAELRPQERDIARVSARFHADLRNLAVLGFVSSGSILAGVRGLVKQAVKDAYVAGLEEGGVMEVGPDDGMAIVELATQQLDHVTDFVRAIRAAQTDKAAQRDILDKRINLWQASIEAAGRAGLNSAKQNEMVEFRIKPGAAPSDESCKTCKHLLGQQHRRKWVTEHGLDPAPGNTNFECGCWQCPHGWVPVK